MRILKGVLVYVAVAAGAIWMLMPNPKAGILGLIFGSILASLNFVELKNTLKRAVIMSPDKAQAYASRKYFLRMALVGVALYVSLRAEYLSVIGTLVGLLSIKSVIMWQYLIADAGFYRSVFNSKRKEE